jgi:hypothetical protein
MIGVALGRTSGAVAVFSKKQGQFEAMHCLESSRLQDAKERVGSIIDLIASIEARESIHSVGLYELSNPVPKNATTFKRAVDQSTFHTILSYELQSKLGKNRVVTVPLGRPYQLFKIKGTLSDARAKFLDLSRPLITSHMNFDSTKPAHVALMSDAVSLSLYLHFSDVMASLRADEGRLNQLRVEAKASKSVVELEESILASRTKVITLELQEAIKSKIESVVDSRLSKIALRQLPL